MGESRGFGISGLLLQFELFTDGYEMMHKR